MLRKSSVIIKTEFFFENVTILLYYIHVVGERKDLINE